MIERLAARARSLPREPIAVLAVVLAAAGVMLMLASASAQVTPERPTPVKDSTALRAELAVIRDPVERREAQVAVVADHWKQARQYAQGGYTWEVSGIARIGSGENFGTRQFVRVWDRGGTLIFRDYIQMWNRPPIIDQDGQENPLRATRRILEKVVDKITDGGTVRYLPANPGTVSTFFSETSDGLIQSRHATWDTARDGTGFTTLTATASSAVAIDRNFDGADYRPVESFYQFDTSALPDADTVSVVTFTLTSEGSKGVDDDGEDLEARTLDWGATLTSADWQDLNPESNWTSLPLQAKIARTAWVGSDGTDNNFTSEAGFPAAVNKTGTTFLVVSNSLSANAVGPTNGDALNIGAYYSDEAGTANDPLLTVTHAAAPPTATPTATPDPTGAAPVVILNEIQGYENVVTTGDILFLVRYELPLETSDGSDAWCAELTNTAGCADTPPAPTAPTSLSTGLAEIRFYTDAALTDLRLQKDVPRIDHALGGLYAGTGHGLTFDSATARVCIESSATLFTIQSTACSPVLWRGAADLAATEALLGPDLVQMMLNLQDARELPSGDLVSGTGVITTANARVSGVDIENTTGQLFALEAFAIADRIVPDVFQTSGAAVLPRHTVATGQTALQTSLDAQASGGTIEVALAAVGQEFFGMNGPELAILLVLGAVLFMGGITAFATRGDAVWTIIAAWVPIVLGSWFRGPTIAVIFTALSVMALLTVLWFARRVPSS